MKRMLVLMTMVAVAGGAFGCGGSDDGMPSEEEVNKAITNMYGDAQKTTEEGADTAQDALNNAADGGS